ncbi:mariner Mos1 transposase [Trichonephila clavipes]|nr:mariner Mos1 transposase [Trichonephila clavipes]
MALFLCMINVATVLATIFEYGTVHNYIFELIKSLSLVTGFHLTSFDCCGEDDISAVSLEHPPYNPDVSPTDFHVFGHLKRAIRGHRFTTDDEVCDWVQAWIRQQPTNFFKDGIDRLVSQCDKCANSFGDYF